MIYIILPFPLKDTADVISLKRHILSGGIYLIIAVTLARLAANALFMFYHYLFDIVCGLDPVHTAKD